MDIKVLLETLSEKVPQLLLAVLVFILIWFVAIVVRRSLRKFLDKSPLDKALTQMFLSLTYYALLIFALVCALGTLGINISVVVASLGLGGFAIGMALKDALGNFIAGMLILFYRPFKVGSVIKISAYEGEVAEINLRYTTLRSQDGLTILVPNKSVFDTPVTLRAS